MPDQLILCIGILPREKEKKKTYLPHEITAPDGQRCRLTA